MRRLSQQPRASAYIPEIAYYLFNVSNRHGLRGHALRVQIAALLQVGMWGVAGDEPHRNGLAIGDLVLIYVGPPERAFVGRAELASAVHVWTPTEAQVYPGDAHGGVLLADVEEWDPPVLMQTVVPRIDPTGSNPYVQANAKNGFEHGVVQITDHEYEAVLAIRAEASASAT